MSDIVLENGLPPEEAPEPVAAETEPTIEPTDAPQTWAPTPQDWEALNGKLDALQSQIAPQEPQQPDFTQYADPMSGEVTMEGLQRFISDQVSAGVNARMSQVEPVLNQTIADRGEALISQKFTELQGSIGSFDTGLARELAEGYASTGYQPDEAIRRGAQRAYEFAQAQRTAAVDEYKTTLGNIGKAPREAGAAGAGLPDEGMPENYNGDKYKWLADNWAARHKLAN